MLSVRNKCFHPHYFLAYISAVVAWIAWATMQIHNDWSWRTLTLFQAIPAFIQIIFIYWVPESPRYHVAKDQPDKALHTLAKYHANGDTTNATVQFEYREIKETLRLEFQYQKSTSYLDFVKTKGNRYRLMLLISLGVISQYSGNALFSNYMNLIYNSMGITKQSQKIPVSRNSHSHLSTEANRCVSLSAQRRSNPPFTPRLCQLRLPRRSRRPPTPLSYLDHRHGPNVRRLDRHRFSIRKKPKLSNWLPTSRLRLAIQRLLRVRLVRSPCCLRSGNPPLQTESQGNHDHESDGSSCSCPWKVRIRPAPSNPTIPLFLPFSSLLPTSQTPELI